LTSNQTTPSFSLTLRCLTLYTGIVSTHMKELSERYAIPVGALIVFTIIGVIIAYIAAPLPSIYSLITDSVVAGYISFSINPVAMISLRRKGRLGVIRGGTILATLAFAAASLITYWSGWPSVPYAVILLAIGVIAFGLFYHVRDGLGNALWYICYILFITLMTYIGDVGALKLVNFELGSIIVILVSVLIFLPWGVASRQKKQAEAVTISAS